MHDREHGAVNPDHPKEIHIKLRLGILDICILNCTGNAKACIIDDDVNMPFLQKDCLDSVLHLSLVSYVCLDVYCLACFIFVAAELINTTAFFG